jgi:hypothetical protein
MRQVLLAFALTALAVCLSSQQSYAAFETYTFTKSNLGPGGTTALGTYGTMTLTDFGTTRVEISFEMSPGAATTNSIYLNFNPSFTSALSSASLVSGPAGWVLSVGSQNADGFGKFDLSVGNNGQSSPPATNSGTIVIDFGVGNESYANIGNFLFGSDKGDPSRAPALFAAEYNPRDGGNTGFIGAYDNVTVATPAPPSLLLAGSGVLMFGLTGLVRRFRRPSMIQV